MRKFLFGFVVAVVAIPLAVFAFLRLGFVDPRADIPVSPLESAVAMPAIDASVDRRAPDVKNPVPPTDDNLIAGMKLYQVHCAECHGDVDHTEAMLADALYPRAPQFLKDAPDMPDNQNFYIIRHGVRLSAMPAWKQALNDTQMWQLTTFLNRIDKLPPQVADAWKAAIVASSAH